MSHLPSEATNATLCQPCAGVQQHWRRAAGHPELVQGTSRTVAHPHGQVRITKYRCERCGAVWQYENNKANQRAGWSLL